MKVQVGSFVRLLGGFTYLIVAGEGYAAFGWAEKGEGEIISRLAQTARLFSPP